MKGKLAQVFLLLLESLNFCHKYCRGLFKLKYSLVHSNTISLFNLVSILSCVLQDAIISF